MGGTWNTDDTRTIYKISSENVIAHDRPQPIWENIQKWIKIYY